MNTNQLSNNSIVIFLFKLKKTNFTKHFKINKNKNKNLERKNFNREIAQSGFVKVKNES